MPVSAIIEKMNAYFKRVEKGEVSPNNLPPCSRCDTESDFFKFHMFRERQFLVIIETFIHTIYGILSRWICSGCGKTYTLYPDFALPYKRYTRQTIMNLSGSYVDNHSKTYKETVKENGIHFGYQSEEVNEIDERQMAPSTVHRWITSLSSFNEIMRKAQALILEKSSHSTICRDLALITVQPTKYRHISRKDILIRCRMLIHLEGYFRFVFNNISIFTKLAINCRFR